MCHTHGQPVDSGAPVEVWRPDDNKSPAPANPDGEDFFRPDILATIEEKIKELDKELRELSLDIHGGLLLLQLY